MLYAGFVVCSICAWVQHRAIKRLARKSRLCSLQLFAVLLAVVLPQPRGCSTLTYARYNLGADRISRAINVRPPACSATPVALTRCRLTAGCSEFTPYARGFVQHAIVVQLAAGSTCNRHALPDRSCCTGIMLFWLLLNFTRGLCRFLQCHRAGTACRSTDRHDTNQTGEPITDNTETCCGQHAWLICYHIGC
jgi:hypothetical protein